MFNFPEGLYTDVRIEESVATVILYSNTTLDDVKIRTTKGAFIRLYDGKRWFYSTTTNLDNIQAEIDSLAAMAVPDPKILQNPIVSKFESNQGEYLKFSGDKDVSKISITDKKELIESFFSIFTSELIAFTKPYYVDNRKEKQFYSSKGSALRHDSQRCGFGISYALTEKDKKFTEQYSYGGIIFQDLQGKHDECKMYFDKSIDFLKNSIPVTPGNYTVVMAPIASGVFAHESFGHKSEADFMVGDETMKEEWAIGKKVGSDMLSIVDNSLEVQVGYTPFDDEGSKGCKTYLIKDGKLSGRLHSAFTASILEEELTGNARSISFEYEPIVRMTNTYIEAGEKTKDEIFSEIKEGIFIETISHGSGMSTFTITPRRSYMIRDGKIAEPVSISVITGNVFETLNQIDAVSNELEVLSFVRGGCGKMEQAPLPVGIGGPYVRVKTLNVN